MRILAFDPGTRKMGWATLVDGEVDVCGTVHFDVDVQILDRTPGIFQAVKGCIAESSPHLVAIESHESWVREGSGGKAMNVEAMQGLGVAVGIILACALEYGARVKTVTPGDWNPRQWSAKRVSVLMKERYGIKGSQDAMAALMLAEYAHAHRKIWQVQFGKGEGLVQAVRKRPKKKGGTRRRGVTADAHSKVLDLIKSAQKGR